MFRYKLIFIRSTIYHKFSDIYNVNKNDIVEEITSFKTFNEFFTRQVKPRPISPDQNEILSPADSKILAISEVVNDDVLLIKEKTYKLGHFLTGIKEYVIEGEILESMKKKKNSKIYQCIFYLNPGDYHRFHSPTEFYAKNRNHIVGYLKPVKEDFIAKYKVCYYKT